MKNILILRMETVLNSSKVIIKEKKDYQLLLQGIALLFTSFILISVYNYFVSGNDESAMLRRVSGMSGIQLVLAFSLFPLLEEVVFRGIFTSKKIFQIIFVIGSLAYVLINESYYVIPFLLYFLYLYRYKNKSKIICYLSTFIFSILHYSIDDFLLVNTFFGMVSKFGGGLILIWVVKNFGLFYSILLHSMVNFLTIMGLLASYELRNAPTFVLKNKDYEVKIEQVSFFSQSNQSIQTDMKTFFIAKGTTIGDFSNEFCIESEGKYGFLGKYNIEIRSKNPLDKTVNCTFVNYVLKEANTHFERLN